MLLDHAKMKSRQVSLAKNEKRRDGAARRAVAPLKGGATFDTV